MSSSANRCLSTRNIHRVQVVKDSKLCQRVAMLSLKEELTKIKQHPCIWPPLGVDFADYPDATGDVSKEIDSLKTEDYAIKKGDSLWKISRDRKTSISILRQLNGIDGDLIREGQVIKVPLVEGANSNGKVIKKTDPEEKPVEVEAKDPAVDELEAEGKPNDEGAAKEEEGPELLPIPEIEDDFALPVPEKP